MKEMVGRALLCRGDDRKRMYGFITVVLSMTEASINLNHNYSYIEWWWKMPLDWFCTWRTVLKTSWKPSLHFNVHALWGAQWNKSPTYRQAFEILLSIICSPKTAVIMSGAGRREVASVKESMPWLEGKWLLDIVLPLALSSQRTCRIFHPALSLP